MEGAVVLQCLCRHASYNLLKRFALVCKKSSEDALAEIAARDAEDIPNSALRFEDYDSLEKVGKLEFSVVETMLRYGPRSIQRFDDVRRAFALKVRFDCVRRLAFKDYLKQ